MTPFAKCRDVRPQKRTFLKRKGKFFVRSQFRLGRKLILLLVSSMLSIGALLLFGSYSVHCRDFDNLYKSDVSKIATTAASLSDGAFLRELHLAVSTEEYQRIREQEDEELIVQWLREHGLYEGYKAETELLESIQEDMDVLYVYVQVLKGAVSTYLISPSDPITILGYDEENPPEFASYTENVHIEPTVTHTEAGWLSSGVEPIFDPDGNAVAVMCVDIDMNRVMRNRIEFLTAMLILGALVIVVSILVSVRLIARMVITPLSRITSGAKKFGEAQDEAQLRESVISFDIRSHDEMEDLYQEIRQMQRRIIDYMDAITQETAERERIGAELSVATQIQSNMLPSVFPAFPGRKEFDIYATVTPAKEVGGDFYDFFLVDDDRLALVVADVSDKGVPAELFMVVTKTIIKNQTLTGKSPVEIMEETNRQLYENSGGDMFVKAWFGILELSTGTLRSVNAGHDSPAYCPPYGSFKILQERKGFPLATMSDTRYEENRLALKSGAGLFIYTDGVIEAADAEDEFFGRDRMLSALNEDTASKPMQTVRRMKKRIGGFIQDTPQYDDTTMLSLAFFGSRNAAPDASAGRI